MREETGLSLFLNGVRGHARLRYWAVCTGLLLAGIAAYRQLPGNGFVNFDDSLYIYANPALSKGLTTEGLRWAFGFSNEAAYWHPLTWLSLMLDFKLFGLNPAAFHLVNLVLHLGSVLLLFNLLERMTTRFWPSAFVAALFALHPLNVEAVAWAAERKTLLCSLLGFAAIRAYLRYVQRPTPATYGAVFLLMALGLMAKPVLLTLPLLLLLLDYWPLERLHTPRCAPVSPHDNVWPRISFFRAVREKLPLMGLSVVSVCLALFSVRHQGRLVEIFDAPLGNRLANAVVSYAAYLGKMIWPAKLAVYYPLRPSYAWWQIGGAALLLVAASFLVLRWRKRHPWLLMGWLWYLVTLFPMIGLVRNGFWPAMADRFAYTPLIGLYIIAAWGGAAILRHRFVLPAGAVLLLAALLCTTCRQTAVWKNTASLFEHALSVTSGNVVACAALGEEYYRQGNLDKAAEMFTLERELNPYTVNMEVNRGYDSLRRGDIASAFYSFKLALFKEPDHLDALYYMARLHEELHRYDLAADYYRRFASVAAARGDAFSGYRAAAEKDLVRVDEERRVTVSPSTVTEQSSSNRTHTALLVKPAPAANVRAR